MRVQGVSRNNISTSPCSPRLKIFTAIRIPVVQVWLPSPLFSVPLRPVCGDLDVSCESHVLHSAVLATRIWALKTNRHRPYPVLPRPLYYVSPLHLPRARRLSYSWHPIDPRKRRQKIPSLTAVLTIKQQQIDDLQSLSREYERQAAMRMGSRLAGNNNQAETFINQPIPVGASRRGSPEYTYKKR